MRRGGWSGDAVAEYGVREKGQGTKGQRLGHTPARHVEGLMAQRKPRLRAVDFALSELKKAMRINTA